ncbi:hypothetical protein ULMA_06790 [Patiriisocius marinus]|uniref:PD-(D/E)XK endonuclease-like domain-containing protein n=1 Tax=Patiriisocius marinus TaxID=1397112 RepID=A0A5J4IYB2_9FLAO|nr:PD-(D/E)XK nuclease family protein [Patiriisocius marinus]GER58571.1 hypothetical protein ULMA_06790 [Patiriisocius marinus]
MISFLEETLKHLKNKHEDLADLTLILPSKRAGGFIKNYLKQKADTTFLAPKIISIETFIEQIANLKIVDNTSLLFKSYEAYLTIDSIQEKESFESYSGWASTLLGDFNEIDRYLLDTTPFFNYLGDIQEINHWYVKDEKTELIKNYLSFWNSLNEFYNCLSSSLLKDDLGYQGLVYRKAAEDVEHYLEASPSKKHVFIGFNALNTAEQTIVQELLENENNEIIWDIDAYFLDDYQHSASMFLRAYRKDWKHYKEHPFNFVGNTFEKPKNINIVSAQKNIDQLKHVGDILANSSKEILDKTAIVLADESLLIPLLHSLPPNIENVNITMGVPLKHTPAARFFELLLEVQSKKLPHYYYKDVIGLLRHPLASLLIPASQTIITSLHKDNTTHLDVTELLKKADESSKEILKLCFRPWKTNNEAISSCVQIIDIAKNIKEISELQSLALFEVHTIFIKISALQERYAYLESLKTVTSLYSELIDSTTLDYQGDAYQGLQIMGVLESRVLDFENIIITSVNEGTLPAGKSNASFITYDLKSQYKLPRYTEKDAIYTYHFTHLIQRAKNITLLYNTQSEGLNTGEKSRFITQLETAPCKGHNYSYSVLAPEIKLKPTTLKTYEKSPAVLERLKEIARNGFSPSSLTSYVRNPIDFYYRKVLEIKDLDEVEETVAANTMGTIVHNALENLYQPFINKFLTIEGLKSTKKLIEKEVIKQFKNEFNGGDFSKGKNLLIFEVAKQYIANFINFEIQELTNGQSIKIVQLEQRMEIALDVPHLGYPVKLGGTVDRVDLYNGQLRIIDYKTGKVDQKNVTITEWESLNDTYDQSKAYQVLAYASMYFNKQEFENATAGIISFKNLKSGFIPFGTKASSRGKIDTLISTDVLTKFKKQLILLIAEICNPEIPFIEKEI